MRHFIQYLSYTLFFTLLLSGGALFAQQRPAYSQYMFNGLALNPAYAGSQKQFNAMAIIRSQWVNFEGAPKTQLLSVHAPLDRKNIGIGMLISHENIGVHTDWSAYASYAYQIKFKKAGTLSLGLQGGLNYRQSDFTKLTVQAGTDPLLGYYRKSTPNFGTGVFYSTRKAYVGLSSPFLVENKTFNVDSDGTVTENREARYYYLSAGKVMELNSKVQTMPSMLLRLQDNMPVGYDLSINFYYNKVLGTGISYRNGDSIIGMFQLILNENVNFGYAYDYTLSSLRNHTQGSHELMLNYRIRLSPEPCHTYF
jgi:type IX secretion system PorP/SprF family membrane protein